ncbi:hypothetical protein BDN70DRAFT_886553 [Pholiota conissans]|uniref:Uncharacterized protein n=1 Tax=Pholiota conissans TaxID=109636 RepID=A0A9P5YPQ0_9AGAR|nr:hypothetical protein BDN70DRAFT_886553 [Pholiota conissans]
MTRIRGAHIVTGSPHPFTSTPPDPACSFHRRNTPREPSTHGATHHGALIDSEAYNASTRQGQHRSR